MGGQGFSGDTAELYVELTSTSVGIKALTDSGDHKKYTSDAGGAKEKWSQFTNYNVSPIVSYDVEIRPNGVVEGCVITPHADTDKVSISSGTIWIAGAEVAVSAGSVTMTRPIASNYKRSSITVSAAGALAEAIGSDDASAYSDTRAATGGPPLVATNLVEIGVVQMYDSTAAAIPQSDILVLPNVHRELVSTPTFTLDYHEGFINFATALMQNHTGPVTKGVYATNLFTPDFIELDGVKDAAMPSKSFTSTEDKRYKTSDTIVSISSGDTGSFNIRSTGNLNEVMDQLQLTKRWFKFKPVGTKNKVYAGIGNVSRVVSTPADNVIAADVTILAATDFKPESG
jgi:hypothetical protein